VPASVKADTADSTHHDRRRRIEPALAALTLQRWFCDVHAVASRTTRLGMINVSEVAEELYRKALSVGEEQEAKLWELRAAVSLARLRRDQGHHTEARDLLGRSTGGSPKASTRPI
jgi:hypothetical protein